jgi:hypothetical protein
VSKYTREEVGDAIKVLQRWRDEDYPFVVGAVKPVLQELERLRVFADRIEALLPPEKP